MNKDYSDFVARMNSFSMELDMDDDIRDDEMMHYGVEGMKWGVRRYQNPDGTYTSAGKRRRLENRYNKSTAKGLRARRAAKANKKIDDSFKDWAKKDAHKKTTIDLGKKANVSKMAYQKDKRNKDLRSEYRSDRKDYKKAYRSNTAYRKGVVRQEVGQDRARKYLSEAKKVKAASMADPSNKKLYKEYTSLMSKYNTERAKARRAADVGAKRSQKIASLKRAKTMAIKGAVATVAVGAGALAVNKILDKKGFQPIKTEDVRKAATTAKKLFGLAGYFY